MMAKSSVTGIGGVARFSPWSPPHEPRAPQEVLALYETISSKYEYADYVEIPPGATHVSSISNRYDDGSASITFSVKKEVPNPKYAKQLAQYKKAHAKYEKDLKAWEEWKKRWDLEQAEKELEMKKAQFKRLKKELGVE
jgi:hypothetical protein